MDPLLKAYVQAFEKQAGFLGAAGKFIGQIPFFIGGSVVAQKLFGKKPKIERHYVPRGDYDQLRQGVIPQRRPQPRVMPAAQYWRQS